MKKQPAFLLVLAAFALSLCCTCAMAGPLSLIGDSDKSPITYKPGEKMVFKIQLLEDESKPVEGRKLKWERRGDDQKTESGEAVSSAANPLTIETSIDVPGFVHIVVTLCDDNGQPVKDAGNKEITFSGGAGVELDKLEGFPEPKDFDDFWAKQKARLAAVPLKSSMTEVPSKDAKFLVFDVKVDCAGGMPVSGYFSKPKDAPAKSLPAKVCFMAHGVYSPEPVLQAGTMVFIINAHGIENGKDPEYYKKISGTLKGYHGYGHADEDMDPETCYFKGMSLRVMRALEFIKSQPEWDGKTLIADGGSQGGFQALAAAGLDGDVTKCVASRPWCCDLGGINLGRLRGWRPDFTEALGYFDPVNHAKRIKGETLISSGLGDYVCPPSGLTAVYNNIKAPKQIDYVQGMTHAGYPHPNPKRFTTSSK